MEAVDILGGGHGVKREHRGQRHTESDLPVNGKQDIAGLEVAVYDLVVVQVDQRRAHLVGHISDLGLGQRFLQVHHDAVDGPSFAELYIQLSTVIME